MKSIIRGNRKLLGAALAFLFVFPLCAAGFAAWPSFQNANVNNGVITGGAQPIASPSMTHVSLSSASVWDGVDATSVIGGGVVYTLYDGGSQGARLQATTLSNGNKVWDVELFDSGAAIPTDVHAINVSQLSTPYLDTANGVIYAAKTYFDNVMPTGRRGGN